MSLFAYLRVTEPSNNSLTARSGSTIIALFPPGLVQWDADLLKNSDSAMETIVKASPRSAPARRKTHSETRAS